MLDAAFGSLDAAARASLRECIEWVTVPGGATLLTQGAPGDALYVAISGRLRASVRGPDGRLRHVRDMGRGEVIGEMSLFTDAPRSASVVALRDSVLARLSKPAFQQLLATSPDAGIAIARHAMRRLEAGEAQPPLQQRPVTMAVVAVSAGVDAATFAAELAAALGRHGSVATIDAATVDATLTPGDVPGMPDGDRALALDALEAAHDFVLLVADREASDWTKRCLRHADEVLLVAAADATPAIHPIEAECLAAPPADPAPGPEHGIAQVLVLVHPADTPMPRGTRRWLARRPVADHVHLRRGSARDMARLARIQSRTAVGLVLAGGGARGLAHLGIYRALRERGVEIDHVGGTSIGSIMATYVATDHDIDTVMRDARAAFGGNPTGDYNWLPLVSLIKGRRLRRAVRASLASLFGFDADAEDLWKNFFCVATDYSNAREAVLRHGNLERALLASVAIPGALPPVVIDGNLLCDGGTFNNYPVDRMRGARGVGVVLGVDLDARKPRRLEFDDVPGTWELLRDRLRPHGKRRYRLPSLAAYLLNVTILYSASRRDAARAATDVYFHPPLYRVGMLEWSRLEPIVAQGYAHAIEVLDGLPAAMRARLAPDAPAWPPVATRPAAYNSP
ncbi:MAG: patatin-like phospholipase family protein [Proteobacteria bacterium]|nr:patatin-like phospholipase family protein [Pseudomonadota bacterium]